MREIRKLENEEMTIMLEMPIIPIIAIIAINFGKVCTAKVMY